MSRRDRFDEFYDRYATACGELAIAPLLKWQLVPLLKALAELNDGELGALTDGTNTVSQGAPDLLA